MTISNPWTTSLRRLRSLNLNNKDEELIAHIITKAYKYSGIEVRMVDGRSRKMVDTNAVLSYLLYYNFRVSYAKIGTIFNKSHPTIIHHIRLYTDTLSHDKTSIDLHKYITQIINEYKYGAQDYDDYSLDSKNYMEMKAINELLINKNKELNNKLIRLKSIIDEPNI